MNLSKSLANRKAVSAKKVPAEKWEIMVRSTNELKAQSLGSKAVKTGDVLPVFNLPDVNGDTFSSETLNTDFSVISFYRGGWCPYCNMELAALQHILPELKALNTSLIAISPEQPDHSLTTSEKNELAYPVLSDIDNTYAKSLGLVFQMPEDLRTLYAESFKIDVPKHNGNDDYELPMPATYVINKNREIIHSFIPEDYTERLDPEAILNVLQEQSETA